eukprot:1550514-Pyramimonas_sp.AAC.1
MLVSTWRGIQLLKGRAEIVLVGRGERRKLLQSPGLPGCDVPPRDTLDNWPVTERIRDSGRHALSVVGGVRECEQLRMHAAADREVNNCRLLATER